MVRKKPYYTDVITNPNTSDGYTGDLYTWVIPYVNSSHTGCTFYTTWANASRSILADSNLKVYMYNSNYDTYSLRDFYTDVLDRYGAADDFSDVDEDVQDDKFKVKVNLLTSYYITRTNKYNEGIKYYLPFTKKTKTTYYASDGIEDDLHEWQLRTSSSTVVGSVYSLLGLGTDTAWETSTLYELDGNVFRPINIKMFGSGGWLDSQGYGDVVYANCTKGSTYIRFSSTSTYPRLSHGSRIDVPVTETTQKLYLPVRKSNGTTKYYI